ncbi:sprT domain-containing protein [Brumimicrobium salinarum]|uniref:SprT domain-containing protein n=1 Tax=Brumimicrobium salinarum TaxID=2058658 RepID=A0A2I0R4G9_9FLAO|nr:SprT-like domain-containing protein [Brumimicrobium salinarum]PKR81458.1 sprT domain-containing protein [Brumimicrobium salinarum]
METKKKKIAKALKQYIPEEYIDYIISLMFAEQLSFRISKPRKTKAGDYRPPFGEKPHRISINGDLNPYAFLITTIHEFAHMHTFIKHGPYVKAHGKEWKNEFKSLLLPVLNQKSLPEPITQALARSLENLKASSCTDIHLARALKTYDKKNDKLELLENLANNQLFRLGKNTFQRGILKRRRYLCREVHTGKHYLVNRLAEVEPINEN